MFHRSQIGIRWFPPDNFLSRLPAAHGTPHDLCEVLWKDLTTIRELGQRPPAGFENTLAAMHLSNYIVEFRRFQTKEEKPLRWWTCRSINTKSAVLSHSAWR